MKSIQIIESIPNYDSSTGVSKVDLITSIGKFTGTARCHPDDMPGSRFVGCQCAEMRAYEKLYKAALHIAHSEVIALQNLYNEISLFKEFDPNSRIAQRICSNIKDMQDRIEECKDAKRVLHDSVTKCLQEYYNHKKKIDEYLAKKANGQ